MAEDQADFPKEQRHRDGLLTLFARIILGAVFVYASVDKILNPAAFAEVIHNYQILPDTLINLTAVMLPWLELVLGLFLIIGLFREGTVCIATILLLIFLGAMIFNLGRGLDIHCGCFRTSTNGAGNISMAWNVMRDGLFLIPAFYLFYRTFRKKDRMVRVQKP